MRIAWFTPFHRASAIGRFSRLVTAELAKSVRVDIWHPPTDEPHVTSLPTVPWAEDMIVTPDAMAAYDTCIYNLGDHLPYHRMVFEAARNVPGIHILHDYVMHHFFAAYYLEARQSPDEYLRAISRWYGDAGYAVAQTILSGEGAAFWESGRIMEFPFFEAAMSGASGVVVHSEFFRKAAASKFAGPVKRLFLAYDNAFPSRAPLSRRDLKVPENKLLIVTVGNVNSNKRVHQVLESIGKTPELAGKFVYAVLGTCEGVYRDTLQRAINEYRLDSSVRLLGYASDDVLSSYLTHADVCINLRYPAMEGASASVIEEMLHGKAVIVTNSGFYGELPSDLVFKIAPEKEAEEVGPVLAQLAANHNLRQAVGARARSFAGKQADPGIYAEGILEFIEEVLDAKPILAFSDRIAARLGEMGVTPEMALVSSVAEHADELFCANGRVLKPMPE